MIFLRVRLAFRRSRELRRVKDRTVRIQPQLAVRLKARHLGKLLERDQMEHAQEFLRRAVEPGPSRHLEPSALLDELTLLQKSHRVRAVHAAHLIDIGARGRLIIGDDGQHLQRRLGQPRRLPILQSLADIGSEFG